MQARSAVQYKAPLQQTELPYFCTSSYNILGITQFPDRKLLTCHLKVFSQEYNKFEYLQIGKYWIQVLSIKIIQIIFFISSIVFFVTDMSVQFVIIFYAVMVHKKEFSSTVLVKYDIRRKCTIFYHFLLFIYYYFLLKHSAPIET